MIKQKYLKTLKGKENDWKILVSLGYTSKVYHIKCTANVSKRKEATVILFTDSIA
jgi:hypothetical protein